MTDNRYTDDVHYKGGCIAGTQMLSWAAVMFAWNARSSFVQIKKQICYLQGCLSVLSNVMYLS